MRVLYLHPRAWSGEYPVLRTLRERGHDVCVLEEHREAAAPVWRPAPDFEQPGDGLPTLWHNPKRGLSKLFTWPLDRVFKHAFEGRNLVHRMWVVWRAARHFRPDAIACTDGFSYAIPAAILKRLGWLRPRLLVSYIGGDILDCPEAGVGKRRTPLVRWLQRQVISHADVLRPVSPALARLLAADGAHPAQLHTLPSHLVAPLDSLEAMLTRRAALREQLGRQYGLPPTAPLVISLSGNQKGKGLHVLAAAWPAIRAALPDAHWLLCGPADPWLDAAVWPSLREAGLLPSVHATGPLGGQVVFEHLAAADLHLNPSLCESLNMVTVEAAAVGTPTISSEGAGISDWLLRQDAGGVVPVGDPQALADAVIAALRSPEQRARWRANGLRMAREFDLEHIARELSRLLAGD
jgi:glycosyltransferase involved in cell wall biosynthesis